MNINDLKIKTKILTGAMLLVAITVGFGALSKIYIGDVSEALFGITDNNGKAVEYSTGVERMALSTIMEQKNYLLFEKDENKQLIEDHVKDLYGYLDKVDELAQRYNNTELLKQSKIAREGTEKYIEKFRASVEAMKANRDAVAIMVEKGGIVEQTANDYMKRIVGRYHEAMNRGENTQELNKFVQRYFLASRAYIKAMEIMRAEKEEVNYKNRVAWKKMQVWLPELLQMFDEMENLSGSSEGKKMVGDARNATHAYHLAAQSWIDNNDKLNAIRKEMLELGANVIKQAQTAEDAGYAQLGVARTQAETLVSEANKIIVGTIIASLILGIIIAMFLANLITSPIIVGVAFAKSLADGDLTAKLDVTGKDEIGQLARPA